MDYYYLLNVDSTIDILGIKKMIDKGNFVELYKDLFVNVNSSHATNGLILYKATPYNFLKLKMRCKKYVVFCAIDNSRVVEKKDDMVIAQQVLITNIEEYTPHLLYNYLNSYITNTDYDKLDHTVLQDIYNYFIFSGKEDNNNFVKACVSHFPSLFGNDGITEFNIALVSENINFITDYLKQRNDVSDIQRELNFMSAVLYNEHISSTFKCKIMRLYKTITGEYPEMPLGIKYMLQYAKLRLKLWL
jgi:hypothetical protein